MAVFQQPKGLWGWCLKDSKGTILGQELNLPTREAARKSQMDWLLSSADEIAYEYPGEIPT